MMLHLGSSFICEEQLLYKCVILHRSIYPICQVLPKHLMDYYHGLLSNCSWNFSTFVVSDFNKWAHGQLQTALFVSAADCQLDTRNSCLLMLVLQQCSLVFHLMFQMIIRQVLGPGIPIHVNIILSSAHQSGLYHPWFDAKWVVSSCTDSSLCLNVRIVINSWFFTNKIILLFYHFWKSVGELWKKHVF